MTDTCPSGHSAYTSVNVPPRSMANLNMAVGSWFVLDPALGARSPKKKLPLEGTWGFQFILDLAACRLWFRDREFLFGGPKSSELNLMSEVQTAG